MARVKSLPLIWLVSDARNDAVLEDSLRALPPNSGFVFRHHHLAPDARAARLRELAALAHERGHLVVLGGKQLVSDGIPIDGIYGDAKAIGAASDRLLRLATAHDGDEIQAALAAGADGIFLSPVFHTASHPEAVPLGVQGFHGLAMQSPVPVIALGGMTGERAIELGWPRWGAIDGLASPPGA